MIASCREIRYWRLALLATFLGGTAGAQQPRATVSANDAPCDYRTCALAIVPTWNGLAVLRGSDGLRIANLNFFWPTDVTTALRGEDPSWSGADSAAAHARRAVTLRRVGAALTDGGVVAIGVATIGALTVRRVRRGDRLLVGAGATALLVSVPFQFAADGALSRAVWWHNVRYAR
jgi:hypothetical protein